MLAGLVTVFCLRFFGVNPSRQTWPRIEAAAVWPLVLLIAGVLWHAFAAPWKIHKKVVNDYEDIGTKILEEHAKMQREMEALGVQLQDANIRLLDDGPEVNLEWMVNARQFAISCSGDIHGVQLEPLSAVTGEYQFIPEVKSDLASKDDTGVLLRHPVIFKLNNELSSNLRNLSGCCQDGLGDIPIGVSYFFKRTHYKRRWIVQWDPMPLITDNKMNIRQDMASYELLN
jgi:hypothetical protein